MFAPPIHPQALAKNWAGDVLGISQSICSALHFMRETIVKQWTELKDFNVDGPLGFRETLLT